MSKELYESCPEAFRHIHFSLLCFKSLSLCQWRRMLQISDNRFLLAALIISVSPSANANYYYKLWETILDRNPHVMLVTRN